MIHLIARVLIVALGLLLVSYLVPGITVSSLYIAVITAIVLGLLHLFVKPLLIVLTLPINIITLGLFTFVINAFLFWFAASFIEGFSVTGFLPALIGSVLVAFVSAVGGKLLK